MNLSKYKILLISTLVSASSLSAEMNNLDDKEGERIAMLETRLAELEARLSVAEEQKNLDSSYAAARIEELEVRLVEAEKKARTAEQLATENALRSEVEKEDGAVVKTPTINAASKLLWTQEKQWNQVKPGVSMKRVIELLGPPPRSLDSLKPRVDEVFYYQTSLRVSPETLHGKVSFRKGVVLAVQKPNFE